MGSWVLFIFSALVWALMAWFVPYGEGLFLMGAILMLAYVMVEKQLTKESDPVVFRGLRWFHYILISFLWPAALVLAVRDGWNALRNE